MIFSAISNYMELNGISPVFLCNKTGLTKHCISCSLKGKRNFSIDEYIKICFALNVPYEFFFSVQFIPPP